MWDIQKLVTRERLVISGVVLVVAFVLCVWPTPYRQDYNPETKQLIRTNRITGSTSEFISERGWVKSAQLKKENEERAANYRERAELARLEAAQESRRQITAENERIRLELAAEARRQEEAKQAELRQAQANADRANAYMQKLKGQGYLTNNGSVFYKPLAVTVNSEFKQFNTTFFTVTGELANIKDVVPGLSRPGPGRTTVEGLSADGKLLYSAEVFPNNRSFSHVGQVAASAFHQITTWRVK